MFENEIRKKTNNIKIANSGDFVALMDDLESESVWFANVQAENITVFSTNTIKAWDNTVLCSSTQWDELFMEGGMYITFTYGTDSFTAPVNLEVAMLTFQDRAGIKSKLSTQYLHDGNYDAMADLMNEGLTYMKGGVRMLIRGGYLLAAHTKRYHILDQKEVFKAATEHIHNNFPDGKFMEASYNPDLTSLRFSICNGNAPLLAAYASAWSTAGMPVGLLAKTYPVLEFSTSDTGRYTLAIRPELRIGSSSYPLGTPIEAKHYAAAIKTTIEEKAKMAFSAMEEGLTEISDMIGIKIAHPFACFVRVCSHIGLTKIAKGCAIEALQQMKDFYDEDEITAFDIYKSICEITLFTSFKELATATQFSVRECFNRLLAVNWTSLDRTGSEEI